MATAARVDISLLSHTNVGKTTLARTLLRRDIGEVGDRAHVTEIAESNILIESAAGDSLVLWDTPGFGDSVRLLKRLQQSDRAVGWFLSQIWDRFADRPFWCGQQAVKIARESSDVIFYVVNASEKPTAAAYVDAEMQILGWMAKPVVLLLNQLGPPRDPPRDPTLAPAAPSTPAAPRVDADVEAWSSHAAQFPCVRAVLPFDAFARCWVQEGTLLAKVQPLVPPQKAPAFDRLRDAWKQRNLEVFEQSMRVVAQQVALVAADFEPITALAFHEKARAWIGTMTSGASREQAELERAQGALAARLDAQVRTATEKLVQLHGLTGKATEEVLQRMGQEFAVQRAADADKASVFGGLVSGALGGLAADLGAGGLTFGAGAIIGGVLGAFGARGLARAYNLARGSDSGNVRWATDFMASRLAAALVRYLAVAHFGRGRGNFVAGSTPAHWQEVIVQALEKRRAQIDAAWALASATAGAAAPPAPNVAVAPPAPNVAVAPPGANVSATAAALLPIATDSAREALIRLYPGSASMVR